MRLLEILPNGDFRMTGKLHDNTVPQYTILSHTCGHESQEVTFEDIVKDTGEHKARYAKIRVCG
jgi:hypothetical protein